MTEQAHILVVDDDPRVCNLLARFLGKEGFTVTVAETGAAMRDVVARCRIDLVLLDLVLPDEDGLTLAREFCDHPGMAIVILTGKGKMIDRVIGLEVGADDYIAKPFHLREVLARIRSVLRRTATPKVATPATPTDPLVKEGSAFAFEGWRFDPLKRELRQMDGKVVHLTSGEFNLLQAFVSRPNHVLDRDRLMDLAKGRDWTPYDRSIDTQIGRLRRKIEKDPKNPSLIKTVRGLGYIFAAKVEPV